ncbi:U1 small nuclear ribonucleoprotein [Plasmodium coatneyi]|uniref:U1 small nuclear ribonucleoprotein n=1 Tax=Plasmodium coatneyi TaxID=208452 RepID=A0A1B1E240_9APIC|nr:U1 small nuclear ribonucleoprotein [Plasmodium coatneyi]ANQ09010.1 U1 small nuclear ribonucleoprotein [Plasmodium coatneyi]
MSAIGMPPHILILFQARPPLSFHKPIQKKKHEPYSGISEYVNLFEDKEPPPKIKLENAKERKERKKKEKITYNELMLKELRKNYDPFKNEDLTEDPKKTIFIGRLSYDVNEKKLKKEFEVYGKIKKVKIIYDKNFKPKGYGFIEFEHTKSFNDAYNLADGKKIDNRRILVDVERGRTVKNWIPRRLGGGKGPPRGSDERKKITHNINLTALINKDKYRNDKKRVEEIYKNVPLYNERNDDDSDDGNDMHRGHRHHRRDEHRSSKRDRHHRSRRSESHDHHRHKHRRRDSRDRDRSRDRGRDRHRERDYNRDHDRDRERHHKRDHSYSHDRHHNRDQDKHRHRSRERENESGAYFPNGDERRGEHDRAESHMNMHNGYGEDTPGGRDYGHYNHY